MVALQQGRLWALKFTKTSNQIVYSAEHNMPILFHTLSAAKKAKAIYDVAVGMPIHLIEVEIVEKVKNE